MGDMVEPCREFIRENVRLIAGQGKLWLVVPETNYGPKETK
jgi:hypothetical protein